MLYLRQNSKENMDILKDFGGRIKELRIQKGLSQEELAYLAGVHRTYIGAVERGEKNISLKNIKKVADALNIKVAEIFKDQ